MTSKGLRLLAYGRVSDVRGRSGESFISPEDQMAKCRAYAEAYEHTILEEGLDYDISGGTMRRPVLDRFLAQIANGEAQGLIVPKLDRFARSSRGALDALAQIEGAGGVLISVQEQIDSTTAAGRFVRAIFLATAEWERERIGESWETAKKSAVERGVHITRHAPPGYVKGNGGRLEPHPKHGLTITKAFELAAGGAAPSDVARYLNERELPSGGKTPIWRSGRIKRLLGNRVYLGEARASGDIVNAEAHPPLTDQATWLRAQRQSGAKPLSTSTSLLQGLVRCAGCRHSMKGQQASKSGVAVYRCSCSTTAKVCPSPSTITSAKLEGVVLNAFVSRSLHGPKPQRRERDDSAALAALETARAELAELESMKGDLRPAAYGQALDAALAEVEAAEREVGSIPAGDDYDIARLANTGLSVVDPDRFPFDEEAAQKTRAALARDIAMVLVRPPASRANNLPIEDRIAIIWRDDPLADEIELPKRGISKTFEPLTWEKVTAHDPDNA